MFFVLRNKETQELMHRDCEDGQNRTTRDLQQAKLFKMRLEPATIVREDVKVLAGDIDAAIESDSRIPAVTGSWEIVPVDLRLV